MQALISIIMPVKNAMPYLRDCLDSVLGQTESNWELIAVDDGSDDSSLDELRLYERKEQRIKVIKNSGSGIIDALHTAYTNSKGQLITRMDADDIMMPNKLASLKAILIQHGQNHIATGLVEYFSDSDLGNGYLKYQSWLNKLSKAESNFSEIYKECVIPSPCWMTWKPDLDNCGAFTSDHYPEDYDLCFRFYQQKLKVKSSKFVLHRWRDHASRTSRNDPNYADIHFFDLKIKYFLALDYSADRPLVLWGAGTKGKKIAKLLIDKNIKFCWLTDNPRKIGHDIYGSKLLSIAEMGTFSNPQVIIAIAAPNSLAEIKSQLQKLNLYPIQHSFFFC